MARFVGAFFLLYQLLIYIDFGYNANAKLIQMDEERVVMQVIIEPLVLWLWVGGGVMSLGTLVAAWPRRRRRKVLEKAA